LDADAEIGGGLRQQQRLHPQAQSIRLCSGPAISSPWMKRRSSIQRVM